MTSEVEHKKKELEKIKADSSEKRRILELVRKEKEEIEKTLKTISSKYYILESELKELEREQRSIISDISYLELKKFFKEDYSDPDYIFKKCLSLYDITRVHRDDLLFLRTEEKSRSTMYYTEFIYTDEDMEKIKKILRISIEELETIIRSLGVRTEDLKMHPTGDISYITYTGYGYVVSMLQILTHYHFICTKCFGILHKLHSCEKTFESFHRKD